MNVSVDGDSIFCPRCKAHARFLRIARAAKVGDVSRRTIYNYIEQGSVHAIRLAGKTLRVCSTCLVTPSSAPTRSAHP